MAKPYLSLVLDTPQERLSTDRLGTLVSGNDWGTRFRSNAYVDPVTKTAMLEPAPRSASWNSNGTGNNRRYRVSDYTLTSAKWVDDPILFPSDYWIKGKDATGNPGEAVVTIETQPQNAGMYLAWYASNASQQDWVQMEWGYGANPAISSSHAISGRVYASGKVQIYRYGVYVADVQISGGKTEQSTANTFTDLIILPFRRREVLISSNRGGGGVVLFEDIDATEDDPEITPESKFWWSVPSGLAKVQCAPLRFASSGYVTTIKTYFRDTPTGSETANIGYDANGGTTTAWLTEPDDPTTAYTQSSNVSRVRFDMTGDGAHTPNVYGGHIAFESELASTPDASTVMDGWVVKQSFECSDSPSGSKLTVDLKEPQAIIDAGVANLLTVSNRAYELRINDQDEEVDDLVMFTGRTEPIRWRDAVDDKARRVTLEARDHWKACEHYLFSDPVPLDGMNIIEAFAFLLSCAGFSATDLEPIDFDLPRSDAPATGEWSVLIDVGDTVADWLTRLHDDYLSTWFMGWVPTAGGFVFKLASPEGLGDESVYTLYSCFDDAVAAQEGELEEATQYVRDNLTALVYRSYSDEIIEPEANDIWVTGLDIRTGRPIQAHKADTASQDATAPVHSRPDNWLGEIRKYGLMDPAITNQDALERAANILYDRLTPYRLIAEFTADLLFKEDGLPVWRGDVVTLDGLGDYRIKSFSCQCIKEPKTNDWTWRPTRYVAERITAPAQSLNQIGGQTLRSVIDAFKLRAVSKTKMQGNQLDIQKLIRQMPRSVVRI